MTHLAPCGATGVQGQTRNRLARRHHPEAFLQTFMCEEFLSYLGQRRDHNSHGKAIDVEQLILEGRSQRIVEDVCTSVLSGSD